MSDPRNNIRLPKWSQAFWTIDDFVSLKWLRVGGTGPQMAVIAPCAERSRLLAAYVRSVNEWADAVRSLKKEVGITRVRFRRLIIRVDAIRDAAIRAKAEYAEHRAGHGC